MVGALAVGTGLGPVWEIVPAALGGGMLHENVVVAADEVVMVVEVVESEPEETDVADGGGSLVAGAGAGCWILWPMRSRVWVRASGVCARVP